MRCDLFTNCFLVSMRNFRYNTDMLKKLSTLTGIDDNGATVDTSVLTGNIHVPVIRQQELKEYVGTETEPGLWSDLNLTYDTVIE